MWSPCTTDHGNFYLKFFLLRTKCLLKANKQAKQRGHPRGSQATRNNGQHNSPACTDVLFVKKTDKTKTRHRVRIYILVSGEPSGFTILLLVIGKFFDSIGKFLKGTHSKQQPTTHHASDAHSSPRAVQLEYKLWQTASKGHCAISLDLINFEKKKKTNYFLKTIHLKPHWEKKY